ncbi:hypothetical protein M513_13972 [Trichuris suis]|uniref:Uncharacterized protein n=1 Tax=Trichuris suis TaxID=68888 RepID=A0A085LJK7_9BILA|nr:hypothetical protein M513_13972 [Trichuris suis]
MKSLKEASTSSDIPVKASCSLVASSLMFCWAKKRSNRANHNSGSAAPNVGTLMDVEMVVSVDGGAVTGDLGIILAKGSGSPM